MTSHDDNLRALEVLLKEFFSNETSNERKREIEKLLADFASQKDAWPLSIYFFSNSSNEYVLMYSLSVLENIVNKKWISLSGDDKRDIKTWLRMALQERFFQLPTYLRNKLAKVFVDIGRSDWPHFFPEFFNLIIDYLRSPEWVTLGLVLLMTCSEEMVAPREDLSVARKQYLQKLLLQQIPTFIGILEGHLSSVLEKCSEGVTETPSSSPTRDGTPTFCLRSPLLRRFRLPAHEHQIASLALLCLGQLFTWIPLSSLVTPTLLGLIYQYAAIGTLPQSSLQPLANQAMACINELLSKNCVPPDFHQYLLQMFHYTFSLLQLLLSQPLASIDDEYLQRFIEFLHLFVSIHLRRFEGNPDFPFMEFLGHLVQLTFEQSTLEHYYSCLEIWATFLDYLTGQLSDRVGGKPTLLATYEMALLCFVERLMSKTQFRSNHSELDQLDDETVDQDDKTEWQLFLDHNTEIVAKVARLYPDQVRGAMSVLLNELGKSYFELTDRVKEGNLQLQESECSRLHCSLRDFATVLQMVGRLVELCVGEEFLSRLESTQLLVTQLAECASFAFMARLHLLDTLETLHNDLVEAHAHLTGALRAYTQWIAAFLVKEPGQGQQLIESIAKSTLPCIDPSWPPKIAQSAAQLLVSLTSAIRAPFLRQLPAVPHLKSLVLTWQLPLPMQQLLVRSLVSLMLIPPAKTGGDMQATWMEMEDELCAFMNQLLQEYYQLKSAVGSEANHDRIRQVIMRLTNVLCNLLDNVALDSTRSRLALLKAINDSIQISLCLLSVTLNHSDTADALMNYFLSLFESLRHQMGVHSGQQIVETLLNLFSKEQLLLKVETESGCRLLEKFLKILTILIQETQFRPFLNNVIVFLMELVYPLVAQRPGPEVKIVVFQLIKVLLLNHWKYFFKGNVLNTLNQENEEVENAEVFTSIMQAIAESFRQPDLGIYRENLSALEELNSKCKLYSKPLFRHVMLSGFLTVLIQTMIAKSHDLLRDEIISAIYNMAATEFDWFYRDFLTELFRQLDGVDSNQKVTLKNNFQEEQDFPSFSLNLERFVQDVRYLQICNSSLPAGSVRL